MCSPRPPSSCPEWGTWQAGLLLNRPLPAPCPGCQVCRRHCQLSLDRRVTPLAALPSSLRGHPGTVLPAPLHPIPSCPWPFQTPVLVFPSVSRRTPSSSTTSTSSHLFPAPAHVPPQREPVLPRPLLPTRSEELLPLESHCWKGSDFSNLATRLGTAEPSSVQVLPSPPPKHKGSHMHMPPHLAPRTLSTHQAHPRVFES